MAADLLLFQQQPQLVLDFLVGTALPTSGALSPTSETNLANEEVDRERARLFHPLWRTSHKVSSLGAQQRRQPIQSAREQYVNTDRFPFAGSVPTFQFLSSLSEPPATFISSSSNSMVSRNKTDQAAFNWSNRKLLYSDRTTDNRTFSMLTRDRC